MGVWCFFPYPFLPRLCSWVYLLRWIVCGGVEIVDCSPITLPALWSKFLLVWRWFHSRDILYAYSEGGFFFPSLYSFGVVRSITWGKVLISPAHFFHIGFIEMKIKSNQAVFFTIIFPCVLYSLYKYIYFFFHVYLTCSNISIQGSIYFHRIPQEEPKTPVQD